MDEKNILDLYTFANGYDFFKRCKWNFRFGYLCKSKPCLEILYVVMNHLQGARKNPFCMVRNLTVRARIFP
jgi:hypothetical protein